MSGTDSLVARVSSVLVQVGLERRFVNSLLADNSPGTAQHEGNTIWRDSLEGWHYELLEAFAKWKNDGEVGDLLGVLVLWDERPPPRVDFDEEVFS